MISDSAFHETSAWMLHMERLISQAVEAVTSSLSQTSSENVSPIKVPIPHHPLHLLGSYGGGKRSDDCFLLPSGYARPDEPSGWCTSLSGSRSRFNSPYREEMSDSVPGPGNQEQSQQSQDNSSEPSTTTNREKTFICPTCLKGFRSKQQLNQHSLVHSGIRKYECSYCDKAFKQLSHLQQHQRIHTGEKPYRCNQDGCDRAFAQLSNLQHHLRNHDDQVKKATNKQFKCVICHRSYTNESSLKSHTLKMHIHIKPIESPDDLNSHIKQRKKKSKSEHLYNAPTMVPTHDQNHDRNLGSFPLALGLQERSRLDGPPHSPLLGLGGLGHSEALRHDRMVQSPGSDGPRSLEKHSPGSEKLMSGSGSVSFIELDDTGEVVSASVNRPPGQGLNLNHNLGLDRGGSLSQIMDRTSAHLLNRSGSHLGLDRRNLQPLSLDRSRGLNLVSQGMRIQESSVSSSSYQSSVCTTSPKSEVTYSSPLTPSASHSPISHHSDRLFSQSVHDLNRSLSSPYPHMTLPTDRNPYPAHVNNISLPMDPMSLPVSTHTGRPYHSQMQLSPRMPPMLSLPTSSHMTLPTTPQRIHDSMSFSPLGN
ncbi:uncharacterized protein [Haliotis cracherodii]|uniref:uncharacterized protein isoform X1 n=2 Tax=Haliotis cracherodii TaxID=6455 RepID=UPI0039EC77BD